MKNRGSKIYAYFSPLAESVGHQLNCVRLGSVSELNRTQSDGLSSIEFDLFD